MKSHFREKLKKQISRVRGDQCQNHDHRESIEDCYAIETDILGYALDYIPLKILKKIIKDNEVAK